MAVPALDSSLPINVDQRVITDHQKLKQHALTDITHKILETEDSTFLIHGGMRAGKTSVSISIMNTLKERGMEASKLKIFRLIDNRGNIKARKDLKPGEFNDVFHRSNDKLDKDILVEGVEYKTGISNMIYRVLGYVEEEDKINPGDVILLSELQFCEDFNQIPNLIEVCKERGVRIIFDCLDRGFNALPIPQTAMLKSIIAKSEQYQLMAIDTVNLEALAPVPARFHRFNIPVANTDCEFEELAEEDISEGSILPEDIQNSSFYSAMVSEDGSAPEIVAIALKIFQSRYGRNLVRKGKDGSLFILLPAHPSDTLVVLGDEIYQPMCIDNIEGVWQAAGYPEVGSLMRANFDKAETLGNSALEA